ncbi:hypothetical protein ACLOJK_030637 [Asimina triloba]
MQRPTRFLDRTSSLRSREKRSLEATDAEDRPEPKKQKVPALASVGLRVGLDLFSVSDSSIRTRFDVCTTDFACTRDDEEVGGTIKLGFNRIVWLLNCSIPL